MTEQTETMTLLAALVKQGEALRREVARLAGQCDTIEALIHGINPRFDEL